MSINVEYRADLDARRAKITLGSVTLEPGNNSVTVEQLLILEQFDYFNVATANKIFIYTKPLTDSIKPEIATIKPEIPEPKQLETVKESAKTAKPKATSLNSLTVEDDI